MATEITKPRLGRRSRLSLVVVHILAAGTWIGIDVIVAVLVAVAQISDDPETQSLALRALATFVVWPMLISAVLCLASGILLGAGTKWGLVRYWWVAVKLVMNLVLCALIWFLLRPGIVGVGQYGEDLLDGSPDPADIFALHMPPTISLIALTGAVVLSVFKPWGRIASNPPPSRTPTEPMREATRRLPV
ncbi:MAG: hypothetical protein ACRCYU_21795 [Nocardioides sp.]